MNRRKFLQSTFASSLAFGTGALPNLSLAGFEPVQNRVLVNLFLSGGPDIRHFIVPAFDANPDSFGYKYWSNRWRGHDLDETPASWQARWENDFYHITVGADNWSSGLVDINGINNGVTFGIWKHAGWLIDMFREGHVALVCNAVGGRNRAHDLSSLQMHQGILDSGLNDNGRSGWGGRLAKSAGGNSISVTDTPLPFTFGPDGDAPNYDVFSINNSNLIAVQDSREIGLNQADFTEDWRTRPNHRLANAIKHYYTGLRNEQVALAYQKFQDHEQKVRVFGELIRERLSDLPEPDLISALRNRISIGGNPVNPDTSGNARRVLNSYGFSEQVRNVFDCLAANDLLELRSISMSYGGWDSHADQRRQAANPDINDSGVYRGIESGFRDIFGGQFGSLPIDSSALHCGFSALWTSLEPVDRQKLVITVAGEFGRQIRDNGDAGTDHGKGNIMFIIGEGVNGGVYGEMFQDAEVDKYDDDNLRTPDIDPRTDLDPLFASVCDWVQPNSGQFVFPRTASGYTGERPDEEVGGMFASLMSI